MKGGAIVANSGHFNGELDLAIDLTTREVIQRGAASDGLALDFDALIDA